MRKRMINMIVKMEMGKERRRNIKNKISMMRNDCIN
jgi:hypothetical protein